MEYYIYESLVLSHVTLDLSGSWIDVLRYLKNNTKNIYTVCGGYRISWAY